MNNDLIILSGLRFPFEWLNRFGSQVAAPGGGWRDSSIQPSTQSSTQSSIQRAILDGAERRDQLRHMKSMMHILLSVRLLFLSAAGAFCIWGLLHDADPKVQWYWTVGHAVVLAACVFLVGQVWASLKATWQQK